MKKSRRILLIGLSILGLVLVYVFQEYLQFQSISDFSISRELAFVFKKTLRVILNDSFMLLLIHAWFNEKAITKLALGVQLIDTLLFLPIYLILKLTVEGDSEISSPLLSQLHRLIINPTLMILLIPAIYFQQFKYKT